MALVIGLPRYVALQDSKTGRSWRHSSTDDGLDVITTDGDVPNGVSPHFKFELVREKDTERANSFYSIRCCSNNKYWVQKDSESGAIIGGASEPKEATWDNTLFERLPELRTGYKLGILDMCFRYIFSESFVGKDYTGQCERLITRSDHNTSVYFRVVEWDVWLKERRDDVAARGGPVLGLPRYVALKSNFNEKYVRLANLEDKSIKVDGDDALSPSSKFELVKAKAAGKEGLWNIRCCHNNKYLVLEDPEFVTAGAATPNEHQSELGCTLFELFYAESPSSPKGTIRLRYVHSQGWLAASIYSRPMFVLSDHIHHLATEFTVVDRVSLVRLPKHVAFKGDNGKYLAARTIDGHHYLMFDSSNVGDKDVAHEIFQLGDGSVAIKSVSSDKFWSPGPDRWIWADSDDDRKDRFVPVKVEGNKIALRSVANDNYCKRFTATLTDCLSANVSDIDIWAILTVEEIVIKREIYNIEFRKDEYKIYDERSKTLITREASNFNSENGTIELKLKYTDTSTVTWNNEVSNSLGKTTTHGCQASFDFSIPFGELGKVFGFSAGYEFSHTKLESSENTDGHGGSTETTEEIEATHTVTVPPMPRVKVMLNATEGKCDVPYSYTQRDTLVNEEVKIYHMDDGVLTGLSSYNYHYQTHKYKLSSSEEGCEDDDGQKNDN